MRDRSALASWTSQALRAVVICQHSSRHRRVMKAGWTGTRAKRDKTSRKGRMIQPCSKEGRRAGQRGQQRFIQHMAKGIEGLKRRIADRGGGGGTIMIGTTNGEFMYIQCGGIHRRGSRRNVLIENGTA